MINYSKILSFSIIFVLGLSNSVAKPAVKKPRYVNPALQFATTWRVDSYDLRNFTGEVRDIDAKMVEKAGFFPIGQHIRFEAGGEVVLPGSIDPVTMTAHGPTGPELEMTILQPFEKKLCSGYWKYVCDENSDYHRSFMISEISRWSRYYQERLVTWADVKPVSYTVMGLNKSHHLEIWFAKNGDLMIALHLDSPTKDGSDSGLMAVRLKAVED